MLPRNNQIQEVPDELKQQSLNDEYHTLDCRNFWKVGSHNAIATPIISAEDDLEHSDFERARVHPKFLHSNATSHKWAFGAVAELLDNSVDEICNGATFVKVDRVSNKKDNSPVLLFQDDGAGMDPQGIRKCMSLGFSTKKTNKTIGQYGNGFKTSTMRLGSDVIVFSRSVRGNRITQSVGLLSYTFLTRTGKNDVIVPMLDFEIVEAKVIPVNYGSRSDWESNLKIILDWSPFSNLKELFSQFNDIGSHGTKVLVYNLWFDDDGMLELDFDDDDKDIRLRDRAKANSMGKTRNELVQSHISFTHRYSLRAYASILYYRKFTRFSIILRGEPVKQLDLPSEMKFTKMVRYCPYIGKDNAVKVIIGFTKEAPLLGTYGLNIYHKNRLIKPFWKVLEEASVRGKCVIGMLEADFIEPAHDKQDFERSSIFKRLETRLRQIVVEYWKTQSHLIGYQTTCPQVLQMLKQSDKSSNLPVSALDNSAVGDCSQLQHNVPEHVRQPSDLVNTNIQDPVSINKIAEENIMLFMKRQEYKSRESQLQQVIQKLESELDEVKQRCVKLSSHIEVQRMHAKHGQ